MRKTDVTGALFNKKSAAQAAMFLLDKIHRTIMTSMSSKRQSRDHDAFVGAYRSYTFNIDLRVYSGNVMYYGMERVYTNFQLMAKIYYVPTSY
jgi:hypothetical protein